MLSRTLRRALLDTRAQLPPTFLLPWTAGLTTVSHIVDAPDEPPATASSSPENATDNSLEGLKSSPQQRLVQSEPLHSQKESSDSTPQLPSPSSTRQRHVYPLQISESVRELLPLMQAQSPHYITAHIHGFPYLLTQGDTLRLPFYMHGVEPGDVIRLNRAVNLGSREFTLKASAAAPKIKSPVTSSTLVLDPTSGNLASHSQVMSTQIQESTHAPAPHFVPHIAKDKFSYIDERLFVCRAVVMGVESEPLRIKEKTKRRQRHVRKVKSKHRFTILKIKELRIKSTEEIKADNAKLARK